MKRLRSVRLAPLTMRVRSCEDVDSGQPVSCGIAPAPLDMSWQETPGIEPPRRHFPSASDMKPSRLSRSVALSGATPMQVAGAAICRPPKEKTFRDGTVAMSSRERDTPSPALRATLG